MQRHSISLRIPTAEQITAWLAGQNLASSPKLPDKICGYLELLARWNQKIPLTAIREPNLLLERHFGEAFFAVQAVPITSGHLVDVGSGGGFPAMPIKLIVPGLTVTLIESNGKKCAFLRELAQRIELSHVRVVQARFEELRPEEFSADFITCRAVGQFESLLVWSRKTLKPSGKLVLWLGREDAERIRLEKGWSWGEPLRIPKSRERVVLIGRFIPH